MSDNFDYAPQAARSPSDDVADYVNENSGRIKNPDDVVGFCSECFSEMPLQYMERNVFAHEGVPVPCKWCGGVCIITFKELINDKLKAMLSARRGIDGR